VTTIFEKLILLEKAIDQFNQFLMKRQLFLKDINPHFIDYVAAKIIDERKLSGKDVINPLEIIGKNELTREEEKDLVNKCYELNKSIHIDGIGNKETPGRLHFAFKEAYEYVKGSLEKHKRSKPVLYSVVNILAWIVAVIGIVFLFLFFCFLIPSAYKSVCAQTSIGIGI
jgi:hypothetical protein